MKKRTSISLVPEQQEQVDSSNSPQAAYLIQICFATRNAAHRMHLKTTSYAKHVALDGFYSSLIDLVDAYAESYQGRYGVIQDYPEVRIDSESDVGLVSGLRDWIDKNRQQCGDFSELQNAIDEIQTLCNSTIYKLTTLK